MEGVLCILVGVGGVGLVIFLFAKAREARRQRLMDKYDDPIIVTKIMDGTIWQGQAEEQLVDAIGRPVAVDRKVLKTKSKETWKYNQTAKNRYTLKAMLEDGYVVGWDKKS